MQPTFPPPSSPDSLPYRGKASESRTYSRSAGFALLIYGIFIVILATPCLFCGGLVFLAALKDQTLKNLALLAYLLIPITLGIANMYLGILTLRNHRPHIWAAAIFSAIQLAFFLVWGGGNILYSRGPSTANYVAIFITFVFPFALAALLAVIFWLLIQALRTR